MSTISRRTISCWMGGSTTTKKGSIDHFYQFLGVNLCWRALISKRGHLVGDWPAVCLLSQRQYSISSTAVTLHRFRLTRPWGQRWRRWISRRTRSRPWRRSPATVFSSSIAIPGRCSGTFPCIWLSCGWIWACIARGWRSVPSKSTLLVLRIFWCSFCWPWTGSRWGWIRYFCSGELIFYSKFGWVGRCQVSA